MHTSDYGIKIGRYWLLDQNMFAGLLEKKKGDEAKDN